VLTTSKVKKNSGFLVIVMN